jgi:hypothetical protein
VVISSERTFVDPLVAAHGRIHVIASISLDLPAVELRERVRPTHLGLLCKSKRNEQPQRLPRLVYALPNCT